jgi:hypothetical protein
VKRQKFTKLELFLKRFQGDHVLVFYSQGHFEVRVAGRTTNHTAKSLYAAIKAALKECGQ